MNQTTTENHTRSLKQLNYYLTKNIKKIQRRRVEWQYGTMGQCCCRYDATRRFPRRVTCTESARKVYYVSACLVPVNTLESWRLRPTRLFLIFESVFCIAVQKKKKISLLFNYAVRLYILTRNGSCAYIIYLWKSDLSIRKQTINFLFLWE
jgi:hypothetical protein